MEDLSPCIEGETAASSAGKGVRRKRYYARFPTGPPAPYTVQGASARRNATEARVTAGPKSTPTPDYAALPWSAALPFLSSAFTTHW